MRIPALGQGRDVAPEPQHEPSYVGAASGPAGVGRGEGGEEREMLEAEEEAQMMQWWRGMALLRLALFADEGHPSLPAPPHTAAASSSTPAASSSVPSSTNSSFTACVRNLHVSSFLGVECAECRSRGACAAFARLSQGPVHVSVCLCVWWVGGCWLCMRSRVYAPNKQCRTHACQGLC